MNPIKNMILKSRCSEIVEVHRKLIIDGARNSTKTETHPIGKLRVNIQNTGSRSKVSGLTLQDSKAGVEVVSVWVMYSEFADLKEHDLIKRSDSYFYEIKNLEPNGEGSPLAHMKSYLVKVDNQNEL